MSPYRRKVPAEAAAELERLAAALEDYRRRSAELAHELAEQIHTCLHAGATWGEVGERLGMTKQGAREHWGHYIQGMMDERSVSRPADFPPGSAGAGRRPRAQQSRAGEDSEQGAAP